MAVMRSVFYVPGNNEKMVGKAPEFPADIITLDLEDSVPPAEKAKAREMRPGKPEARRHRRLRRSIPGSTTGKP